jgi:tetratricopeptide (TPR) repeat protein
MNKMKGNPQAITVWNQIASSDQQKLLTNVFCSHCHEVRSTSDPTVTIDKKDFLIKGDCATCGKRVVRYVEVDVTKNTTHPLENPDYTRLLKLAAYPKNGKFNQLLDTLPPLILTNHGVWKINDYDLVDEDDSNSLDKEIYHDVMLLGNRPWWEMEQIMPNPNGEPIDEMYCPILEGIEITESEGNSAGMNFFKSLLKIDHRCLDAYAHIGNIYFNLKGSKRRFDRAKAYYKQGVAIGLKAIGEHIHDVFPWGMIDNRPFLRCLHGFGLCLLEQQKIDDAFAIFKHMLLLNPLDNQGARFMIADIMEREFN